MSPLIISKYLNSNDIDNYVKQETNVNDFKGSIIISLIVIIIWKITIIIGSNDNLRKDTAYYY